MPGFKRILLAFLLPLLVLTSCLADSRIELPLPVTSGDEGYGEIGDVGYEGAVGGSYGGTGDGVYEETVDGSHDATGDGDFWGDGQRIRVVDLSGEELWSFTQAELRAFPAEQSGAFAHAYSTINNWPSARYYVADGYSIECILRVAGVLDTAQTVTFRSSDGYEVSLTREQLLGERYFYPQVGENASDAEPVAPIIAYRWREGTIDLSELRDDKPSLIFGQMNPNEHTNPAFVEDVAEIIVDDSPCQTWEKASTFPLPGLIMEGETVKLQHPSYGLVKLHYTLDSSDPTASSPMYNPSTYQPELNVPIQITDITVIKVLVTGYGKNDSEIAVFGFEPVP